MNAYNSITSKAEAIEVWRHLERAHILSQDSVWRHFCIHFAMLVFALSNKDWKEAFGQLPRILLSIPSSLFSVAPKGNTGRANVGMFASLPMPPDLRLVMNRKK